MRLGALFYTATALFLISTAMVLLALDRGITLLTWLSLPGFAAAGVMFFMMLLRPRRRVNWDRIQTEQRLWESGPLGRTWLRIRQRISGSGS
jgi:hypothetical protein